MALFHWNDSYSVGIDAMDRQHQCLIELISRLYDAMRQGQGDAEVGKTVRGLARYAQRHFAAEEALMRQIGFPQLTSHQAEHKALTDKVGRMTADLDAGKKVAAVHLATFLKDWLVQHIQQEDRRYGAFICNGEPVHK